MNSMSSRIAGAAVIFVAATSSVMAGCQAPDSEEASVPGIGNGAGDAQLGTLAKTPPSTAPFPT